jgi:cellulose synthase/poly-beta-1,6-N-acetylglucosamine synthase-like glycosyltransferase
MDIVALTCAGTNVMIRARAAFKVSKYAKSGFMGPGSHRKIYSEDEISEDMELGTRIHAAGYKSIFIPERLCTGEVCLRHCLCCKLLKVWTKTVLWPNGHPFVGFFKGMQLMFVGRIGT